MQTLKTVFGEALKTIRGFVSEPSGEGSMTRFLTIVIVFQTLRALGRSIELNGGKWPDATVIVALSAAWGCLYYGNRYFRAKTEVAEVESKPGSDVKPQ